MTYNCAFANCIHNTNNSKGCTYTNFPRDEARRRQWIQISGNKDLVNKTLQQLNKCHVCNCHFNTHEYTVKDKRFILNSLSILPTVKTPDKPLSDDDMVPKQPVIHPRLETIAVVKKIQPNLIRTVVNRNANSRTSGNELKKNPMKILGNQEKVLQPLSINNSSTVKELTPKSSMVTEQDNFVVLEQAAEGNSTPSQPEDTMAIEAINAPRTMDVPSLDQIISMGSLSIDQSVTSNETAITGQIDDHLTNLVVPTNISTTPDTRSSSPDKDISSLPSGSERRRKKKKSNLHLLLPPFNDPDSSIIPNRDVREANRTEIDDHPTGSMVPMDTLTIPDTRTSTPGKRSYSSNNDIRRATKRFGLHVLLARGAINQLEALLQLKAMHSHSARITLLTTIKLLKSSVARVRKHRITY